MDLEKNIYGLSEGVFKACQFLGLKFPSEVPKKLADSQEHFPSDYFGDDFELDEATIKKLCAERKCKKEQFLNLYKNFVSKIFSQKYLKQTKTDLNVYFCDYLLFDQEQQMGIDVDNYFSFEFYKKSFSVRCGFISAGRQKQIRNVCNDSVARNLASNKAKTNKLFADFLHRDWVNAYDCTFRNFKLFIEKYPRFFSKPFNGSLGNGAEIIDCDSNEDLEDIFAKFKSKKRILEEIIIQHYELSAFCPNTVNTIRVCTILDIHNVVHILTASGRFGRMENVVDNFSDDGIAVIIDPKTGIITSDGMNKAHEFFVEHPDTGKTFKGFQYPCWDEVRATVKKMAKMISQLRHVAWDITINNKGEVMLVEANANLPGINVQQAPDSVGRFYLYDPFLNEIKNYKWEMMRILGYTVNDISSSKCSRDYSQRLRTALRLKFAMGKLIPDCTSLIDLGCRKEKFVKSITPPR